MASRKRRRSTVEEYTYESSDDERCKTPPPLLHRHTHIESQNGRLRTQQLLYSMPSSPDSSTIRPQPPSTAISGIDDAADDMLSAAFNDIESEQELADHVTGNDSDRHRVRSRLLTHILMFNSMSQTRPLLQWIPEIDVFLQELLQHEGRGASQLCSGCGIDSACYRCMDCFLNELYCKACIVGNHHRAMPFHRIQVCASPEFLTTLNNLQYGGIRNGLDTASHGHPCAVLAYVYS